MGLSKQAISAVAGALSFEGSTSDEGTLLVPASTTPVLFTIPIPAETNKLYRLRTYCVGLEEPALLRQALFEQALVRLDNGSLSDFGTVDLIGGLTPVNAPIADGDNIVCTSQSFLGDQLVVWRWVLSPVINVPFPIVSEK